MQNRHRNAERIDRSFPFNLNAMSILGFCRAIDYPSVPAVELDMFSRWIKLSDDLLAKSWKSRRKLANPGRGKFGVAFSAKPA